MAHVITDVFDDVTVVTLNRPRSLNAWTMAMQREVAAVVRRLGSDQNVAGIVLTGAGDRAFCAGQDLQETAEFTPEGVDAWLDGFADVYDAVLSAPKPVVAALNGTAAGSGYQLALVCDIRIAHPAVRIGQPEVTSGIPSVSGMFLTWQSLGHSRTVELMLSGRLMDAAEAHEVGLVHEVVPRNELHARATLTAARLASQPALAFNLTKQRIRDMLWPGLVDSFRAARDIDRKAWASGEPQATARRFFEARRSGTRDIA